MAYVVCKNTFLDVISGEDARRQRSKSAGVRLSQSSDESSSETVELQLVRLNRLFCLDSAETLSSANCAEVAKRRQETDVNDVSDLTLSHKSGQRLMARGLSKMQTVQSNASISTMCPVSECPSSPPLTFDDVDAAETNVPFELSEEECPTTLTQPTRIALSSLLLAPAQECSSLDGSADAARPGNRKVPRTLDLAAAYEKSGDNSSPPTTIMIRNLPNRYTQHELMSELEELGFVNTFDFLYAPMDKCTRANLGYAFVNFVDPSFAEKCLAAFNDYRFARHRDVSSKIAKASVAHLQGLEKNIAHYANTVVNSSKHKQRRPIVLTKISNIPA